MGMIMILSGLPVPLAPVSPQGNLGRKPRESQVQGAGTRYEKKNRQGCYSFLLCASVFLQKKRSFASGNHPAHTLTPCCSQPTGSFGKHSPNYMQREDPSATQVFLGRGV